MFAAKNELFTTPSGYQIQRSLRFRSSATAYFNRTFASTPTSWTASFWVKRGTLGGDQMLLASRSAGFGSGGIRFKSDNTIAAYNNATESTTNAVYRDCSGWYHFVISWSTSNVVVIYCNGVVQSQSANVSGASVLFTSTWTNTIGRNGDSSSGYFDGYLAEVNYIEGQVLTPSSFGSTNAVTGVWSATKYAGTYGTNGFYLPFTDNSAATATTIGKDFSGNGNNWTPNNISVTAGVTYDSMLDAPLGAGGGERGNYSTLNPLSGVSSGRTLDDGNLNISTSASKATTPATIAVSSGKWYWEITCGATNLLSVYEFGIVSTSVNIVDSLDSMTGGSYAYYGFNGNKYSNSTGSAYGATFTNGDVIGHALDLDSGTLTFYKNNTSQGTAFTGLSGTFYPAVCAGSTGSNINFTANFGQRPFSYTPPTGFKALHTGNLGAPVIALPAQNMAATLYTGTGASLTVANTVNSTSFQPDWVWVKGRSGATDHALYDSVRGVQKQIESNSTGAETTETTGLTAFGSTGFTVGALAQMNTSAATYVAWQWKAGGTAVSNTSGSITSSVSANVSAGFSVVTYTGTGANATVGHGLGVAPSMVIVKNRSSAVAWGVWHTSIANTQYLVLNTTAAAATGATWWNSTTPTSTVFSIGTSTSTNTSAATYVAYCFAPVAGYSAYGSYTGNGSTDGPFVYTGFRPRFVMVKSSSNVFEWVVRDSTRSTYNLVDSVLNPNSSAAEVNGGGYGIDFLSNGFKVRAAGSATNGNTFTYIYMAFAEDPFKNSLAR